MEVRGHQDIQSFRTEHHPGRSRIDQHPVRRNIGIVCRDRGENFVPEDHPVALGVGLGYQREHATRALPGQLEGKPHDPKNPGPGEDGYLHSHLLRMRLVRPTPDARVFPFRVLADDDPVQIPGAAVLQRTSDAGQDAGGADVGVLIESLADGETQTPQGNVVRNGGMADGAEVDGVKGLQRIQAILRHHSAMGMIVVGPPWEGLEGHPEVSGAFLENLQDPNPFGDDLQADPVGGDGRDAIGRHDLCFLR